MSMKIEVCDNCGGVVALDTCKNCGLDWKTANIITVYTDRELKQAQIEAYEDAMRIYHHSYPLTMMRDKITDLKQSMKE